MKSLLFLIFLSLILVNGDKPKCNLWKDKLTSDSMQLIVDYHNKKRNTLATEVVLGDSSNSSSGKFPFASNMLQMYWSHELATEAQKWADNCQFEHSDLMSRKVNGVPAGENLALEYKNHYYAGISWQRAIDIWWGQKDSYQSNGGSVDHFEKTNVDQTGAFTQIIWANTYLVGCGFARMRDENKYSNLYVCRYGPTGNIVGMPVYFSNPSVISHCPHGTTTGNENYKGLCCIATNDYCHKFVYNDDKILEGTVPSVLLNNLKLVNKLK